MAKSIKDRLLTLGAAAVVGLAAIPLSNMAVAADEFSYTKENSKGTIHLPESGTTHWNVDPTYFMQDYGGWLNDVVYENLQNPTDGNQVLYINVDMNGYDEFILPSVKNPVVDGWSEESAMIGSNVLWTFYDSSKEDGAFEGTIRTGAGGFYGSVLAPKASFLANGNVDGTVIVENFEGIQEFHKAEFLGSQLDEKVA
ncbi:MAG: choice-of-anchor A family protein, partial [Oscillospiraceae bacterium]|nr:choice-of-anchor A family protein [Oscillospiraceae bacterium]